LLLLFDIDGTLLRGASMAHAETLRLALQSVHHIPVERVRPSSDAAGRTDGEIARIILLAAGVSAQRIDELAEDVRAECCRLYAQLCPPDLSDTVVDGIPDVLEWLDGLGRSPGGPNLPATSAGKSTPRAPDGPEKPPLEGLKLSLVTGNFEPVARLKLKRAGLGHWFAAGQGAFGSDSEDRAMLPAIARRRAGAVDCAPGISYPRDRTILIGDTPRDIACGRADGVRCVAVCSGPYGPSELTGADAVARDAGELRGVLTSLIGL
jgi:phosphoglycolate phosphatase-like HAD superfamily hydrolase